MMRQIRSASFGIPTKANTSSAPIAAALIGIPIKTAKTTENIDFQNKHISFTERMADVFFIT